ncbi:hypothetical protein CGCA056_v008767 [Colletotrichum aenigma]|uniref:uncharacterized protein n=1 Tax=Colletotrichum aenigma TaxID=1215731 RepID=UPI001872F70E|nr:uncharacterized protein CGCA056_v008767 [Colletotrichum aenigma]KAF5521045.1 hypothetical protein CGCA056_v008767 [Colletotrichum aenigma]
MLTFTANHLLSLRLITLASEDPIYYSLRPTTYDHDLVLAEHTLKLDAGKGDICHHLSYNSSAQRTTMPASGAASASPPLFPPLTQAEAEAERIQNNTTDPYYAYDHKMDRKLDINAGQTQSINDLLDRERGIANDLLPILWRVNRLGDPMADDQSYKRARDAIFKAVFRNWNIAGAPVHVKVLADLPVAQLTFSMADVNGSVFSNALVVTHVTDYNLLRLRTEVTMKWNDAEIKRHGTSNMEWVVYFKTNRLRRSLAADTHGRHTAVHGTSPGKQNIALTPQCYTLKLIDNDLCVDLLYGQFFLGYSGVTREGSVKLANGVIECSTDGPPDSTC